ncbi:3-phosphoglycerate dehydrogenase family protein [Hutsoniella sourekii]
MTKQRNIQILNNIDPKALKDLPKHFNMGQNFDQPDAILVRSAKLHDATFDKNVKYIGRAGAGTNNIPIDRCSEQGIVVCNAPGANANGVKELVLMALVMASRNVFQALQWTESLRGQDQITEKVEQGKKQFVGHELQNKKIGVVGLGSVGGRIANMCVDFGMTVYGYDPYVTLRSAWGVNSQVIYSDDVETLFRECDFISLNIPYTEENHHFVNENLLMHAKPGLKLINMARDGLVDLQALKSAIEDGRVATYVVDFPEEATLNMPNTINIPHLGASTPESQINAAKMVANQLEDYLENGNITNSVNYPDVHLGKLKAKARITVNHRNIPNMLGQLVDFLRDRDINIATLANNHRGDWAYTMIDIDSDIDRETLEILEQVEGVVRLRLLRPQD